MECPKCRCLLMRRFGTLVIKNSDTNELPTEVYQENVFECTNKNCGYKDKTELIPLEFKKA